MKKKHLRLPNGFGQITKLSNPNLRKPYRAMITVGKTEYGKPICKLLKPVSYFETYNEAYAALIDQNRNPYEVNRDATLKQVYEDWIDEYSSKISASRTRNIKYTFKKLEKYQNIKLADFKPKLINQIISERSEIDTGETVKKIKSLLNLVMDYAVINEIIDKNHSRISKIKIDNPNEVIKGHITFSDEEISALWNNKGNLYNDWILIQCYTGMRPSELCILKIANINLDENYMIGGIKTEAGIDRIIPIHPAIKDLISKQIQISVNNNSEYLLSDNVVNKVNYDYFKFKFYSVRDELNLNKDHTPHDCRKFFISQAKKYQLNEYALKRIVGHKITDLTERVYTVRESDWLYDEICKISAYKTI